MLCRHFETVEEHAAFPCSSDRLKAVSIWSLAKFSDRPDRPDRTAGDPGDRDRP